MFQSSKKLAFLCNIIFPIIEIYVFKNFRKFSFLCDSSCQMLKSFNIVKPKATCHITRQSKHQCTHLGSVLNLNSPRADVGDHCCD